MSVTVSEILLAARGALAVVSSETAGYLVLGAAECLGEGRLGLKSVYLDEGGALHVDWRGEPGGDAESSLRSLLKRLLETGRSPAPALLRVATTQERRGLPRLITEIEAALIPVNRSAARRALARLHRDVSRARTTSKLFDACPDDLVELEPSRAQPPTHDVVDHSTDGPTPVVAVAAETVHVVEETVPVPEETVHVAPETHLAAPAPVLTAEPDATPFLGTVATTVLVARLPVREHRPGTPCPAPVAVADDPEGDIDTDPAPPVELDGEVALEVEARDAPTVVLGTYDLERVPVDEVEIEIQASPPPGEASLYVAIPVVALRESTPFVEADELLEPDSEDAVEDENAGAGEQKQPEERDALEMLLFEGAAEKDAVAGTFTSMFELLPDGTAEPPKVVDDDALFEALPPLLFAAVPRGKDRDAIAEELGIDVPATPLAAPSASEEPPSPDSGSPSASEEPPPDSGSPSASEEPPQETSFGHLAEALIDEALAVEPRRVSVLPHVQEALRAPAVAHTATVPGLGFVNVRRLVPPVAAERMDACARRIRSA